MATKKKTSKSTKKPAAKKSAKSSAKKSAAKAEQLPASLDIVSAGEFYTSMKEAVKSKPKTLVLDAGAVERITTPCIQILLSASLTQEDNGGGLAIENPSETMEKAFADLGLSEQLDVWRKAA